MGRSAESGDFINARELTVREPKPCEKAAWDAVVLSSAQAHGFLDWDFLDFLSSEEGGNNQILKLCCYDQDGTIAGAMAACLRQYLGRFITEPVEFFCNNPFMSLNLKTAGSYNIVEYQRVASLIERELMLRVESAALSFPAGMMDVRPFVYSGWKTNCRFIHRWDLSDTGSVWNSMASKKRAAIRRACKEYDISLSEDIAQIPYFMDLYQAESHGYGWAMTDEWKRAYVNQIRYLMRTGRCRLYTANKDGRFHGGLLVYLFENSKTAFFARSTHLTQTDPGDMMPAIYWTAAQALSESFKYADLGGSAAMPLSLYKDYLGAKITFFFEAEKNRHPILHAGLNTLRRLYSKGLWHAIGVFRRAGIKKPAARQENK